jgi:hypothetical protein
MTRNLKALGLALIAAFAMTLVVVSAASAVEFHSEAKHTTLEGEQTEPTEFAFEAGNVQCEETVFKRTQEGESTPEVLMEPEYLGCTAGSFSASISTNGCAYRLHSGEKAGEGYDFLTDIVCPGEQVIDIHTTDIFGTKKCTITIPGQVKRKKVTYTNKTSGSTRDVLADIHISGTVYYQHAGTGAGACKTGWFEKGTKKGTATTRGFFESLQVGVWVE